MKKITAVLIIIAMLTSFTVIAAAEYTPFEVMPGDEMFNATMALEHAQLQVSKGPSEQALLENEFANKRMEALEQAAGNAEGFGAEVLNALMAYLAGSEENLGSIIAQMAREKDAADLGILEEIETDTDARGCRLLEMIEEGTLPETALTGVQKALDNMAAAAEKAASANEMTGEQGPEDVELPVVELPVVDLPDQVDPKPSVPAGRP